MSELTDKIKIWMEQTRKDLIKNYDANDFRASGEYERELTYEVSDTKGIKAIMYTAKQAYWMENGRRPNKDQSKEGLRKFAVWAGKTFIAQWIADKNFAADPIAVAYSIGKKGYSVSDRQNVISEVLTDERLNELLKMIDGYFKYKIKSDILKNYK